MRRDGFLTVMGTVMRAREQEIVCSTFFERLPRYVDLVTAASDAAVPPAEPPARVMPDVAQHISQCAECAEAYHLLSEMTSLEG
jgi:hypothetical protein